MRVEWDLANQRKHDVSFGEAAELLESEREHLEIFDADHSDVEDRFISIGVVLVVWTERDEDVIRITRARWATNRE